MNRQNTSPCQLIAHEGTLYEFIWSEGSQAAVDLWAHHMDSIYHTSEADQLLRFIHRFEIFGMPPVSRIVHAARRLQAKYPQAPPTRSILISESNVLVTIIANLSKMLNRHADDSTRFFNVYAYDEAIQWLLADEAQNV